MGLAAWGLFAAALLAILLWRVRPAPGPRAALVAAVVAAGLGYLWQGRPFLPAAPAAPPPAAGRADPLFAAEWRLWLGEVGPDADLLAGTDRLIAGGAPDYAVGVLRGATARAPDDMVAWIGLGHALAAYAGGVVTPAARFCFDRAAAIAPAHPAPAYFLGLARFTGGDLEGALADWRALRGRLPDGPPRRLLDVRIATAERLRGLAGG